MRLNRKAVTDLPIKLLVISIILSISIPIVTSSLESSMDGMESSQMNEECQRIANSATSAYYSTIGAERYLDVDIPAGCSLVLGGEGVEAYAIHMYRGSEEVSKHWMEKPMIPFKEVDCIEGKVSLRISADTDGIEVTIA